MVLSSISRKIADNQRNSFIVAFVLGLILYITLLFFNDWNPISLITGVISLEFSLISNIVMRFLSGLGISLTYATFCSLIFRYLAPSMKGSKTRVRIVIGLALIPALGLIFYGIYTIWGAIYLAPVISNIELLSMIFGVWSLILLVYVVPIIKGEYSPEIEQSGVAKAKGMFGNWRFSIWRSYKSSLRKDYGRVYEKEFEQYGLRLFMIRAILSGLVLLPISLVLIKVTPLAILSIAIWLRMFSLNYKNYSDLERGLLIVTTISVALLTTIAFYVVEMTPYRLYFNVSYGFGLLSGILLLFAIILRK
jgi:MFS family permease